MGLLPRRAESEATPDEPRVLDVDGEDAAATFDALGSETARQIMAVVYEQPRTPVEIREEVGTSLQNVHYHVDNLEEADLLKPAGVGYSEKGNEMTVYAPASEAVVLFAGGQRERSRLEQLVGRVLGLYFVLALATVGFHVLYGLLTPDRAGGSTLSAETTGDAVGRVGDATASGGLDPTVVFFLGGLVALCGVTAYWYLAER
ncbi:ArsR family transcriptional regulator [Haloglomus irregulare]|jgi:DNA-binding transcriptional ArsR family regulator|uniref:ArsR family transcriptional regulator n=1 Tax=Haloglomus irregulare TaxID=2234134 RepID=A0A554N942_9EURY|nr:winged helix-turn-helix domain-containing protein [Haloglomus irregulare]TSD13869.1 ArsR family transcriptional regulator [Haloglomus irregulare]